MTTPRDVPRRTISLEVNGERHTPQIEDRQLLVEVIRNNLGLTGTHTGCLNGDCGACTVEIDGRIKKSCLVLAASVDGASVTTVEGLATGDEQLSDLQLSLWQHDAFQCGFCLPGQLFAIKDLLENQPDPSEQDVRDALVGNLCRCTGYVHLVEATLDLAQKRRASGTVPVVEARSPETSRLHHLSVGPST